VPSGTGRERASIVGAVDCINDKYIMVPSTENITKEIIVNFLRELRYQVGGLDQKIRVVLDNARYQHAIAVKSISRKLNIELTYLPPYSSYLNLIERVWKYMRCSKIKDKFQKGKEELVESLEEFSKQCKEDYETRAGLKSILTLKFERLGKYIKLKK
jgi:transposase